MRRGIPAKILTYISGEFLKTLALTLITVTGLWVVVSALQVLRRQFMGPVEFLTLIPLMAVVSLAYTLPVAVLFGASVSYGRMSFDNEISAMEWNGVHFGWIALPAVIISVFASGVALYLTSSVVPRAHEGIDHILHTNGLDTIKRQLTFAAQSGQSIGIDRLNIALKAYDADNATMRGVTIIVPDKDSTVRVDAPSARILPGRVPGAVLVGAEETAPESPPRYITIEFIDGRVTQFDTKSGLMTATGVAPPVTMNIAKESKRNDNSDSLQLAQIPAFARSRSIRDKIARQCAWTDFFQRIALGTSPLFFALLAVPMALVARWKHALTSFLPSLIIAILIYYPLLMWGATLGRMGSVDPRFGMFFANAAIFLVSAFAIAKIARR